MSTTSRKFGAAVQIGAALLASFGVATAARAQQTDTRITGRVIDGD